jgi:hypothetical protein
MPATGEAIRTPMDRPFRVRHARNLQAGIQEGRGVDSRLKTAGMTRGPTALIGSLTQHPHEKIDNLPEGEGTFWMPCRNREQKRSRERCG